jgi:hypothetical protein
MAFRKKSNFILAHKPDILIIVECEHPDKLIYAEDSPKPNDFYGSVKISIKALQYFLIVHIVLEFFQIIMKTIR